MVKTVTTARCHVCDWVPEGTPAAVDRAADKHTRAEKHPTATVTEPAR